MPVNLDSYARNIRHDAPSLPLASTVAVPPHCHQLPLASDSDTSWHWHDSDWDSGAVTPWQPQCASQPPRPHCQPLECQNENPACAIQARALPISAPWLSTSLAPTCNSHCYLLTRSLTTRRCAANHASGLVEALPGLWTTEDRRVPPVGSCSIAIPERKYFQKYLAEQFARCS